MPYEKDSSVQFIKKKEEEHLSYMNMYEQKYPNIYNEANQMYQTLMDKYPQKYDFTKLYYFKKWQKQIDQSRTQLYVPHLPILFAPEDLRSNLAEEQQFRQQEQEEPDQHQPERQEEQQPPQQEEEEPDQHQPERQEEQQPPQQEEELRTGVQSDLCSGMSIDEMSISVEEMIKALQSDRQLMDIVEGFDLPDGAWDNELAIPDYVLESDLDW